MKKILLLLLFFKATFFNAQNLTDLDPNFNIVDIPQNRHCFEEFVAKLKIDSQGKMLYSKTVGTYPLYIDENQNLIKDFADGSINDLISEFEFQADGKILISGNFTSYNGTPVAKLFRLNADLTIDSSFSFDTSIVLMGTNFSPTVKVMGNKIYFKGSSNVLVNGVSKNIVRLNMDGSIDTTFNYSGINYKKVFFTDDGKVFLNDRSSQSAVGLFVIRLNNDGSIDPAFVGSSPNRINTQEVFDLKSAPGGGYFLHGRYYLENTFYSQIVKLNDDWTFDTSFNQSLGLDYQIRTMDVQQNGKVIISGTRSDDAKIFLFRFLANGNLDPAFGISDFEINSPTYRGLTCMLPNDKFYFSCSDLHFHNGNTVNKLIRFNADGSRDRDFENICKGFANGGVTSFTEQPDGKIIVGGTFDSYNGTATPGRLIRLNADGTIDEPFLYNLGRMKFLEPFYTLSYNFEDIKVLPDNKIFLAGRFKYESLDGITSKTMMILNPDGTLFKSYEAYEKSRDTNVGKLKIDMQSDGKILVYGGVVSTTGYDYKMLRIDANYDVDTAFPSLGMVGASGHFKVLPDDKILVSAWFVSGGSFKKFNSDGTLDSTFSTTSANFWFDVQPDGKILTLNTASGNSPYFNNIERIDSNGSNRVILKNLNLGLRSLLIQPNSNVIFINDNQLKRMDGNALVDTSLAPNSFDGPADVAKLLSNGKIAIGGMFNTYNNHYVGKFAVLRGEDYYFVNGQNRLDSDLNGCAASDMRFPGMKFNVSNGTSSSGYFADATGNYSLALTAGNYTITPVFENPSYYTVTPTSIQASLTASTLPISQNFCIVPNGTHQNLEVVIVPINTARPGFDATYKIIYKNSGNFSISGQVELAYQDGVMDLVSSNPLQSATALGHLTWNYTNLFPSETREINLKFNLNRPTETPPLNQNDVLSFNALIFPIQNDENQSDNSFNLNQTIIDSYDPNDKTCLEGKVVGTDLIGKYVHYVIRFENTGTGNAQKVVISDEIDLNKFDISSLQPLIASHLFTTKIDGNKVSFEFDNINLPFNENQNKGYVSFKIKLKNNLVAGNTFENQAQIYFDYNYPIITNNEVTTIEALSRADLTKDNSIKIYPNPASDFVNIKASSNINSIEMYDVQGRILMTSLYNETSARLDLSRQSSGIYYLKVKTDEGSKVEKLLKR